MIFDGNKTGSGYDHVPGGDEFIDRSAFSFHYYCSTFSPNYNSKPRMQKAICDRTFGPLVFQAVDEDLAIFKGAAMMTEGMSCDDSNQGECIFVQNLADSHLISWTDYGHSQTDVSDLSDIQKNTWARTYGRAIAGTPTKMKFDIEADSKDFELCWTIDATITAETEVFASSIHHYTNGVNVAITGNVEQVESGDDDLFWFVNNENSISGDEACVKMTAK